MGKPLSTLAAQGRTPFCQASSHLYFMPLLCSTALWKPFNPPYVATR
jgi:hypothetical protein